MAQNVMKITFSKFYDFSSNCQKWSDGHPRAAVGRSDAPQITKLYAKSMRNQTFSKIDVKLASKPRNTQKIEIHPHFLLYFICFYHGCNDTFCTPLHCIILHCTALHCIALHCTAPYCTALHYYSFCYYLRST